MVIGNPFRFGFILDYVSVWSSDTSISGIFMICIEAEMFPKKLDNAILGTDLYGFFHPESESALIRKPVNLELFHAEKREAFMKMFDLYAPGTFFDERIEEDNDYTYLAATHTMADNKSYLFAVSDGEFVRVLGSEIIYAKDEGGAESYAVSDVISECVLPAKELNRYVNELRKEYILIKKRYLK